ncbi:MAG: hypothetical protein J1F40_04965 [Prevotellaceae bacterium]|nr:hypothetical protein [Prevotellaceae bacterium]
MTNLQIKTHCKEKEQELLDKYFGNLVREAAIERSETIGEYTMDLPLKIEAEFREFLEELWKDAAPEELKGKPLPLEKQTLRRVMTGDEHKGFLYAYKNAIEITLWERITKTNPEDVTYYKGLLEYYTQDLLRIMSRDFWEKTSCF